MASSAPLSPAFSEIGARIDSIRQCLAKIDTEILAADATRRGRLAIEKSGIYIWLASALESFVSQYLSELLSAINKLALPKSSLRGSLFSMLAAPQLDRLRDIRRLKMWQERAALFPHVLDTATAALQSNYLPLDGRTLKPEHFETVWLVFALPAPSLPGPLHKLALTDLGEWRNRLAHGEEDPVRFGRHKTVCELRRTVQMVEDIAEHLFLAGDQYMSAKGYLR